MHYRRKFFSSNSRYLDFDLIRKNPKIFCGYSDITTLHFALYTKCNFITFYGPTAIAEFGEKINFEKYTEEYFFKAVASNLPIGKVSPSEKWTDCRKANWLKKEDLRLKREYKKNKGYEWLRKGKAEGKIIGGCITSMMHTKGTEYWPDFSEKILLLETPEGESFFKGEPLSNIDGFLADLRLLGILKKIKGLIFGRGFGYSDDEIEKLKEIILFNTRGFDFPILYGLDIGHTDPKITIPLGVSVTLDSEKNIFSIDESGVN
ncbi:MAG: LD-carboxypeptidase [Candidatus Pacearchaeota archaeon]